jgi:hypothetical protein
MDVRGLIHHQPRVTQLSTSASVPATGGAYRITEDGATFPRADVSLVTTAAGTGVDLHLVGAPDGAATFTLAQARDLVAALAAALASAERAAA